MHHLNHVLSVTYNLLATAGVDFSPVSMPVTFSPTVPIQSVEIVTMDDSLIEGSEFFIVNLAIVTENGMESVSLSPQMASVTVTDNDGEPGCVSTTVRSTCDLATPASSCR